MSHQKAVSLRDLLTLRAANRDISERAGVLGSVLGRKNGTGAPAVRYFVDRKVHERWLGSRLIPARLRSSSLECLTDVVALEDFAEPLLPAPLSGGQVPLRTQLRGGSPRLQPGSQLAFLDREDSLGYGTLAAFAVRRSDGVVGLLTNAHVGVFVGNRLHHPELWATEVATVESLVERETYPTHLQPDPSATDRYQATVDACFAPLHPHINHSQDIDPRLPGLLANDKAHNQPLGPTWDLRLDDPTLAPVGLEVVSVGRTRAFQPGVVVGYAYETRAPDNTWRSIDYLIRSTDGVSHFSDGGDSGKLVLTRSGHRPLAMLWGGGLLRTDRRRELVDHSFATDVGRVSAAGDRSDALTTGRPARLLSRSP